jgi:leucyl aminopeptidase
VQSPRVHHGYRKRNFGISSEDAEAVYNFIQLDKDAQFVEGMDSLEMFVKESDNAEKMRKHGAAFRGRLDKKVMEIAVAGDPEAVYYFLEGFLLASYQFLPYFKDAEEKAYQLENIIVDERFGEDKILELINITAAVFWARDMVNEPVSFLNAEQLAAEIADLAEDTELTVNVLEQTQIESLKMGGLLAVNQGSVDPATFTIVEYKGKNHTNKKPIVLVGKGVVYDTGGLSIKPTPNSMDLMKSDMGGAACMAGAIYLAALQELPIHIIALIPATDNRPGLNAYAPGDVVTMYNGMTVEVLNTDAEGRMIMADALSYSKKYDPELVIDAATLTGAAVRAIGAHASCVMGNADDKYFEQLEAAGKNVHERTVRFPFWEEYGEEMKSSIADLKNLGGPTAGMITAGKFLENFVEAPYMHIDLAGPAFISKNDAYRTKGGTGVGVRLLYNFFKNYKA